MFEVLDVYEITWYSKSAMPIISSKVVLEVYEITWYSKVEIEEDKSVVILSEMEYERLKSNLKCQ